MHIFYIIYWFVNIVILKPSIVFLKHNKMHVIDIIY